MEAFNSLSHRDSCFHHFTERIIKQVRLLNMNDHVDLLVSLVKKEKKKTSTSLLDLSKRGII